MGGDGQWRALCEALGRDDLKSDQRFQSQNDRYAHRPELNRLLHAHFVQNTSAHWLALLEQHGVPAGPIYKMDEVFADPQVRHLGMAQAVAHPTRGSVELIAQPVQLSRTPARLDHILPDKGADTEQVLREAGCDAARIAQLRELKII